MKKNNKLWIDTEHEEYVVNGNRMSKESILNLISVGLFMNLRHVSLKDGSISPNDYFALILTPDEFESWLSNVEQDGVSMVLSYSEDKDVYIVHIASSPYKGEEKPDENNTDEIGKT